MCPEETDRTGTVAKLLERPLCDGGVWGGWWVGRGEVIGSSPTESYQRLYECYLLLFRLALSIKKLGLELVIWM